MEEIQRRVVQDVMVEIEQHEASEDMRTLAVERRTAVVEGLRVSDTARVVLDGKAVSEAQSS